MILYGRDLSPFARRVAIQCAMQGREIERRAILVTGDDFTRLRGMNPIGRVPVLELDDGTQLIEAYAICDWLDETSPNGWRLLPASGDARRTAFQRLATAVGTAEKGVALVYDRNRRPEEYHWADWQARLETQIQGGLAALDAMASGGWSGSGGDVASVIAYQFVEVTNPHVLAPGYSNLEALVAQAMDIPAIANTKPQM